MEIQISSQPKVPLRLTLPKLILGFTLLICNYNFSQVDLKSYQRNIDSAVSLTRTNPSMAVSYGVNALEIAIILKDERLKQEAYLHIGTSYRILGDANKAEEMVRKAHHAETDSILLPEILRELGVILKQQTRYNEALPLYLQSIDLYKKQNKPFEVAKMYNNIGRLYFVMEDYNRAMEYYQKSLIINKKKPEDASMGINLHNIGAVKEALGDLDSAKYYFSKALIIYEKRNDQVLIAYGNSALGNIEQNEELARQYLSKSLNLRKKLKLDKDIIETEINLGDLEIRFNNLQEGIRIIESAYNHANRLGYDDLALRASKRLAVQYKRIGDVDKAYHFSRTASSLSDSLHKRESRVKELGFAYRFEQLKLGDSIVYLNETNKLQELQIKVSQTELEKKNQAQIMWTSITVLSVLLGLMVAFFLIRQRKINKELHRQKDIIEIKNLENETLIREVHHRVKNNLHSVISLLRMEKRKQKNQAGRLAFEETEKRVHNIAAIHEQLYKQVNLSNVNMIEYLKEIGENVIGIQNNMSVKLTVNGQCDGLNVDKALPLGQLVAELITNSSKHAFHKSKDPKIKIHLQDDEGTFTLNYKDNGSGFDVSKENNTYGMSLIRSLSNKLKGNLALDSLDGFSLILSFPK